MYKYYFLRGTKMAEKIRFSEWRLGSEAGGKITSIAKRAGYSDKDIREAIAACDVYIPFNGYYNNGEDTSETKGMETASDDLFDSKMDFEADDNASKSLSKNYSNATTQKYVAGLTRAAYNKRTDIWDMEKALTTGEKVKVRTTDANYERVALNNEIILINTFIYLSGKSSAPKVLARPALESAEGLVVYDTPMTLRQIQLYFNIYFSYCVEVAMYDLINPYNSGKNVDKLNKNKKELQKKFADKAAEKGFDIDPNKDWDKAVTADGIRKRKWGISKVLGADPDDLNLSWFFDLSADFLVEGFWEAVQNGSALKKIVKDNPNFNTNKGILLDDKFQSMISSVDNLLGSGFTLTPVGREDEDTSLMNWIANAIRLRFNYYKKVIFTQAQRQYNVNMAASTDAMAADKDEKSGASRLEKAMFDAGAYTDSPEDEIALNQSIDNFFKKEKYWLTDEVSNFNDTFPILRYITAMIEYPCCPGTVILSAVGTGHIVAGGKHINNWAGVFTADRKPAKGSLTQLSIEVSKKLKQHGLLDIFMGLTNHFGGDTYRIKFLNNLKKVFVEFEGTPDESATIPLTFKPHSEQEIRNLQKKGIGNWFIVDNNYVQRSIDKWHKYTKPLEGTENESLIEQGENMILDACDMNLNAIVSTRVYNPTGSLLRKFPDIRGLLDDTMTKAAEEEKIRSQKLKDEEKKARDMARDQEMSDTFFFGRDVPNYVKSSNNNDDEDVINESIFKDIYRRYMKKKLFETIYENAQKRG